MRGTYIGPLEHLRGHKADLIALPDPNIVLAQFDDIRLTREPPGTPPGTLLGFDRHAFPAADFKVDE